MRAIVLGAGASFGASHSNGVPCPMVDWVFSAATQMGLLSDKLSADWWSEHQRLLLEHGADPKAVLEYFEMDEVEHLGALKGFVEEQLSVTPDQYLHEAIDFERLMGLVEGQVLGFHELLSIRNEMPRAPHPADVMEQQLYLVLCGSLIAATRNISCEYHEALARWLQPGDIVISFNYDLLMDRALEQRGDWAKNDGYGLTFHRIGTHGGVEGNWRVPLRTKSANKLYKLHGSLNWLYCRDPWQMINPDLHGAHTRQSPDLLYCLQDMNPAFEDDHPLYEWWARYEHEDNGYSFDLFSLIVPPTFNKAYRNVEPFLGTLWGHVLWSLIAEVKEIYFIGYSMREQDLRSWWLFRKAAAEGAKLERIAVVDPSDAVLKRIEHVFRGKKVFRAAHSLAEFATALPPARV